MSRFAWIRNFIVGLVFLGSLVVVGVVTIQVTGLGLPGQAMDIKVRFDRVNGLKIGDEVRIYGYRVGHVRSIDADLGPGGGPKPPPGRPDQERSSWSPSAPAEVRAARDRFRQLTDEGYEAFRIDKDGERAELLSLFDRGVGSILFEWPRRPILVTVRIKKAVELTRDTLFQVKSAGPLGGNYMEIVLGKGEIQAGDSIFRGSSPPELFEELGNVIRENRAALRDSIDQLRDAVRAVNEREGTIGALLRSPELKARVEAAIDDAANILRSIREEKGPLGMLIMNTEVRDQWKDISSRVKDIADDVQKGKGTVGMLLKDEKVAKKLRDGVDDLQEMVAKMNEGEGSLGQIINNREAWDRVVFVLRQVQEAVEDFREQAPISTFVNAIFAAY